jgi:ketosteroid isomerase-like protein
MSKTDRPWLWIAILAFGSAPLSSSAKAQPSKAAREISRLENLYSQSFVTGDERTPERLLADDFIGFGSTGKPSDKTAVLAEVRSLPHQASAKITSISVRVHGDTAIALGTEDDFNASATAASHRRWLDTWMRTAKGWRLAGSAEIQPAY